MNQNRQNERGSALILVVALALLAGLLMTLGIGRFGTQDNQDKIQITAKRQQFLVSQLAAYAQRNNQIPCPADPATDQASVTFGFSRGSAWLAAQTGANVDDAGACNGSNGSTFAPEGIVPFRTLGLESYDALDGWGHEMTYRVSTVLTNPTKSSPSNDPTQANIFGRCRMFPWFDDGVNFYNGAGAYAPNSTNVNPQKALFCCPPENDPTAPNDNKDLLIYSKGGVIMNDSSGNAIGRTAIATPGEINPLNTMYLSATNSANGPLANGDGNQELFAFAIISHGANGIGAFVPNSSGVAVRLTGNVGANEAINANQNNTPLQVIDHPMVLTPGNNYYDDMVVWRTQISLMGELNGVTCYQPWR